MIYNITPVPKPRQTRSDKWNQRPSVLRYRAFADEVRAAKVKFDNGDNIIFGIPMPKSWSKRKKREMVNTGHTQKPDIDNLTKALLDALYQDDAHIWLIGSVSKIWALSGYIKIY